MKTHSVSQYEWDDFIRQNEDNPNHCACCKELEEHKTLSDEIEIGNTRVLFNEYLCDDCIELYYNYLKESGEIERCTDCDNDFIMDSMYMLEDETLCEECYNKRSTAKDYIESLWRE